jgi:hypothetical protein
VNEDEERVLRVSIGKLARQLRELVVYVGAINSLARKSSHYAKDVTELHNELEKDLLDLEASVLRVADAFPPEAPMSTNSVW